MVDNPYLGLRSMALAFQPSSIGVTPTAELPHVFGVVMDMGYEIGTATALALADGTVSMYTSTGGGTIGAGSHEQVRSVGHQLLLVAEANLDAFGSGLPDELPAAEHTQITVLTYEGSRRASAATNDFGYGRVPASPVFLAVHDVITKVRELDASPN